MQDSKKNDWITYSFTDCLIEEAKKNKKIIVLDADLSDDVNLKKFSKKYPKRFIQNGIAEQDMVSMAGGLALTGLLPVVNSFASFLTARANEQIYNNATENTKIIYMCLYAGILPAGAGKSHQSLRDISLLSSIPNMRIYHPYNYIEVKQILKHCINLEKKSPKRKSCVVSRSFGQRIENFQELREAIAGYSLNASEKIRSESLVTKSITVFVRTSPFQNRYGFYSNSKTIDFPIATNNSIEIVKSALNALEAIFKNGYRYQKAGVMLSRLSEFTNNKNLFSSEKDEKINNLMKSIDNTNYRYGRSTLSLASAGIHKRWDSRRQHYSKIDTADFYSLPTIKAI